MLKKQPTLRGLLLVHEIIFLLLVVLAGGAGGYGVHLWRIASAETVRISQLSEEIQQTRGDLYRQMKELFDAQFLADPEAKEEYEGYTKRMNAHFAKLGKLASGDDETQVISNMHAAYQNFLTETHTLLFRSIFPDNAALEKKLNSNLELRIFRHYENVTSAAEKLLSNKQQQIHEKLRQADRTASLLLAIPVVLGLLLLVFSRLFLQRAIASPISSVLRATQEISTGKLQQRVPEAGAAEVARLAASINQMAEDLTRSQEALLRSEKQAAQGALVPVLAHNIRNPLASIRATAQVADDASLDADTREAFKAIIATVDRLERWTGALLAYLHPLRPQFAPTTLLALLTGAISLLESRIHEKNIQVSIQNCEIKLHADIHLLEQAIYNLLQNAVEASPLNGQLIIQGESEMPYATLTITDNGPGIPFTPEFSSLTPGPSTKRFGTGLGIPFAFKVCEAHGGTLSFSSLKSGGTQVSMKISAYPEDAELAL